MLVIRKSSVSSRSSLPSGASSRQATSVGPRPSAAPRSARSDVVGAEQVLEEVLVALGRGAEQVGPPHGQAPAGSSPARPGPRRRTAGRPALSSSTTCSAGVACRRRCGLVGQVERVAVERRVATASSPAARTARSRRPVCLPAKRARRRAARPARRRRSGRSATGRCAGTSTRCRIICRGGRAQSRRVGQRATSR